METLTPAEVQGVRKALALVRKTKEGVMKEGMCGTTFFFGLINIVLSAVIVAAKPQHFWAWQTVKSAYLLVFTLRRRTALKKALFMLDFCWAANIVFCVYGMLCLADLHTVLWPVAPGQMFLAIYGLACGPLGWSVLLQHNAMVLHSPDHTAALFIHLSPPIMAWSFRFFGAALQADWGSRFGEALVHIKEPGFVTFSHMWSYAALAYALWWVPYTAWLLAAGRHQSPKTTGQDTVWAFTLRKDDLVSKLLGVTGEARNDPNRPVAIVKYMLLHATGCLVSLFGSYLMWQSFALHTAFCLMLFTASAWSGAKRYTKMTTRWYEKAIEDLLTAQPTDKKSQ